MLGPDAAVVVVADVSVMAGEVSVVVASVVVVSVDVDVSVDVEVESAVEVASVVAEVEPVSVDEEESVAVVSVAALVVAPVSANLAKAPAVDIPMMNSARIATTVHAFFRGPPFFASGAIRFDPFLR
jgi:hypothetical protein